MEGCSCEHQFFSSKQRHPLLKQFIQSLMKESTVFVKGIQFIFANPWRITSCSLPSAL
jgi:hypothetical protein